MLSALLIAALATAGPCPYADLAKRDTPSNAGVTAQTQLANSWNKIISSPAASTSYAYSVPGLFLESMAPSVTYPGDSLPDGRTKKVHAAGAVLKIRYVAVPNQYTGIFNASTTNALYRYSLANEPKAGDNIVTGNAFKFFRDNVPSANTFFMTTINGQADPNFYVKDHMNHIATNEGGFAAKLALKKFSTAPSNWAAFTGTSDMASFDYKGNAVARPVYPFQILFRPSADARAAVEIGLKSTSAKDAYRSLKAVTAIPKGTLLWTVYASPSPNGKFSKIADVYADSETVLNAYGDDGLFFKHQVWDEDVKDGSLGASWKTTCPDAFSCVACHSTNTCQFA